MISRERATASPAPPLVFHIAVKMAAAINIPLSFLLKKRTPALQSTKFVKINFDDQDGHDHDDAVDDTA